MKKNSFNNIFDNAITKQLEPGFNKIVPITSLITFIISITIFFTPIPNYFAILNLSFSIIFAILFFFEKQINIKLKVLISSIIPIIIAILAFLDGGFSSSIITLLMLSNLICIMFLNKYWSRTITLITGFILLGLAIWSKTQSIGIYNIGTAKWTFQILLFVLYLISLHTLVYLMQKHLLKKINELEESVKQTYHLAFYDSLTNLPNEILFKKKINEHINNKNDIYLIIFSLKNLNMINSIYSEDMGNDVIKEISNIFRKIIQNEELIGRVSGNKFALLGHSISDVESHIKNIQLNFSENFYIDEMNKKLEFQIGYVQYKDSTCNEVDFYHNANLALNYAKYYNNNKAINYNKKIQDLITREETIKERLRIAILNKEIIIYYQPKVNVITGNISSVEALARWNDPVFGFISPEIFIPMLKNINMIVKFGELIIENIFSNYSSLCKKYNNDINISINISPSHLTENHFTDFLKETISKYHLDAKKFILEITEETLIEGIDSINTILYNLRTLGFKISLDDFGTGYSSLNYLTSMAVDELKIDKSFIHQLDKNSKIDIILELIINLAKSFNINIVAEGVETKEQYDKIKVLGCNEIQGYYFFRPEPIIKNEKHLQT